MWVWKTTGGYYVRWLSSYAREHSWCLELWDLGGIHGLHLESMALVRREPHISLAICAINLAVGEASMQRHMAGCV